MISFIWKISVRNLLKHKVYTLINVFGLGLGFTAFIMIGLFLQFELNWDKSNLACDRIYRIQRHYLKAAQAQNGNDISPHTSAITAQLIENKYPEIEKATVIKENGGKFLADNAEKQIFNDTGIAADSCYLDVFTYKFLEGSQKGALDNPFSIILSKTMSKRLFDDENALGRTVTIEKKIPFKVTGVYEDLPENTSLRPGYIVSFSTLSKTGGISRSDKTMGTCMTYLVLRAGTDYKKFELKIRNTFSGFKGYELEELQLCPLKEVYLNFNGKNDYIIVLFLYGSVGLFILLMSVFNYINLTIANASTRGKEVALKKVCGSNRFVLVLQFLGEAIIISIAALIIAFELVSLFLPVYAGIIDKPLNADLMNNFGFIKLTLLTALAAGLISGVYPAMFLSSQSIQTLFKGGIISKGSIKVSLKHTLVTFQFAISIFLIVFTLLFTQQLRYLSKLSLGFDKESLLYATISVSDQKFTFDQLRNKVLQHPEIENGSISKNLPYVVNGGGMTNWEGGDPEEKVSCRFNTVSYDFVKNLGISLIEGRDFSRDYQGDISKSCLINEAAVKSFGWEEPIGKRLNDYRLTVVGVVKNYVYHDQHNGIEPIILTLAPEKTSGDWVFAFRVDKSNIKRAKDILTAEFKRAFPNDPFEFRELNTAFNNENSNKIYHSVMRTIAFFTIYNICLAIVGLLGLVSFTSVRRSKEIGIRKINGSSSIEIFYILCREYMVMLIIALFIACPSVFWVYEKIPGANKQHAQAWVFVIGAVIIFLIILLTTSYQTLRAATRNPVEALRYE
jgi:putative ABC transport system permease protein